MSTNKEAQLCASDPAHPHFWLNCPPNEEDTKISKISHFDQITDEFKNASKKKLKCFKKNKLEK